MDEISQEVRIIEALLFAATEPVSEEFLAERLPISTRVLPALALNSGVREDRHAEFGEDHAMISDGGQNRDIHMNTHIGQNQVQQIIASCGAAHELLQTLCCTNLFQDAPLLADAG